MYPLFDSVLSVILGPPAQVTRRNRSIPPASGLARRMRHRQCTSSIFWQPRECLANLSQIQYSYHFQRAWSHCHAMAISRTSTAVSQERKFSTLILQTQVPSMWSSVPCLVMAISAVINTYATNAPAWEYAWYRKAASAKGSDG